MAYIVADADQYFAESVLHNEEWVNADYDKKQRALNNAGNQLYRIYKRYDEVNNPLPVEAVYEQALWLLRLDDTLKRAEQGVRAVNVAGVSVTLDRINNTVAPQVVAILGRKVGRYV
jgi:hypothetical protein